VRTARPELSVPINLRERMLQARRFAWQTARFPNSSA
jgi:hypothetical protein